MALSLTQETRAMFLADLAEMIATAEGEVLALERGDAPERHVNALFRIFHTIKGGAAMVHWPALSRDTHQSESLLAEVRAGKNPLTQDLVALLLTAVDRLKAYHRAGPEGSVTTAAPAPPAPTIGAPPAAQAHTIRVSIPKLTHLGNLVGQMVSTHGRLMEFLRELEALDEGLAETLTPILDDHERQVRDLHDEVNALRMVPIGPTLHAMQRLVRDYAAERGKPLTLRVEGEEIELDREVIERVNGPLKHLVRNAMDHGIEPPAARQARGKPAAGCITLRADHRHGVILLTVADDGGGLDHAAILATARRHGLLHEGEEPSRERIEELLFAPGFSTRLEVSDISGRGVGLDAVRQEIHGLGGSIAVSSHPGEGTVFAIRLPLTLAILEGMLVGVGDHLFTLPLRSVVESLLPAPGHFKTIHHRHDMLEVRGSYLPVIRLHRRFRLPEPTAPCLAIVVEHGPHRACLLVDTIIDQQIAVIKSLEEHLVRLPDLAGATVLGDGRISLILDVAALIGKGVEGV